MKTLKDLRELINGEGGGIKVNKNITAELNETGDIDFFKSNSLLIAWFSSLVEDDAVPIDRVRFVTDTISENEEKEIKKFLGDVESAPVHEVVEVDNSREETDALIKDLTAKLSKAEGKVIAYENLLIGRDLTISK